MPPHSHHSKPWFPLALGALGVVYGDIGTSPLYALRECFHGAHALTLTRANVLGILSLIFWSLLIVISVKYLLFVMRADNRGEGGILALISLIPPRVRDGKNGYFLVAIGIFGAALLYGDGMITPAISVLSAVEGLTVATPVFAHWVVPITIGILVALFFIQSYGTGGIGTIFGPVMLLWFATLAVLGVLGIVRDPSVLWAIAPSNAVSFFLRNRLAGFLTLGSVFLVVTGGEALYADMGHFGKKPIKIAWFALVLPSLLINYFGQGALLISQPTLAQQRLVVQNPFYHLAPDQRWILYSLVALATLATVIASQALISGAFSLTRQAIQLGYCPRLEIVHTSGEEFGQIYVPTVNWLLMVCTIGLVLGFKSSTSLAAAYGIAVTMTMVITTYLAKVVAREVWGWKRRWLLPMTIFFSIIDLSFFGANIVKVHLGGWVPLLVGSVIYFLMVTWRRGRQILAERLSRQALPFASFVASIQPETPPRVPGTAVFMARDPEATPTSLLHNLKHNKVLHDQVILLTIATEEIPEVPKKERITIDGYGKGCFRVLARYGFMQDPSIASMLEGMRAQGIDLNMMKTTFFLGRETLIPSKRPGMAIWREKLFAMMSRNALRPTDYFRIPANRVIELGMQVEL
ncbi:MAG TPA: potassium transporter Kup [Thermoanaerobaculia bacterium]|nr:potassium transporter Kup [Thermoanaerobaculia bacterium]